MAKQSFKARLENRCQFNQRIAKWKCIIVLGIEWDRHAQSRSPWTLLTWLFTSFFYSEWTFQFHVRFYNFLPFFLRDYSLSRSFTSHLHRMPYETNTPVTVIESKIGPNFMNSFVSGEHIFLSLRTIHSRLTASRMVFESF